MNVKPFAASIAAISLLAPGGSASAGVATARPAAAAPNAARAAALKQRAEMIVALRKRVKYVFVLYQENRSFDSYFGTFPGADGIYSAPPDKTLGYAQTIENVNGTFSTIHPFRIGPAQYAADTDDVDHSHPRIVAKMDVTSAGPQMDKFALTEELKYTLPGALPTIKAKQYGELTMAHEDCDTIPLLWNYANRFVLFDHIFQSVTGPSTPGNIAIVAAQAGQTQEALHPSESYTGTGSSAAGVPVVNDRDPAWGPYNPTDGATPANVQINLTFASLPLLLAGVDLGSVAKSDPNAAADFVDTRDDVATIVRSGRAPVRWGWFQEGYDKEPGEASAAVSSTSYITHHNGPQYFGYVANSTEKRNFYGLGDFETALTRQLLPASGGVAYVKGGYQNIHGLLPVDPDPAVQQNFVGDDDHPGYSDAEISESQVAREVNLIAASKYWNQSAIVITYDDSEGDYDHVAPPLTTIGPGVGNAPQDFVVAGPRVPLIVISPFAKSHSVQHAYGDHGSVVKLVEQTFGLGSLAALPDEQRGFGAGAYAGKLNEGPDDGEISGTSDLLDAFDHDRLTGAKPLLPSSYAYTNPYYVNNLPAKTGLGCSAIGVIPVDELRGIRNEIPADFNPRPGTDPTQATEKPLNTRAAVRQAHDIDD